MRILLCKRRNIDVLMRYDIIIVFAAYMPYEHFYVNGKYITAMDRYETSDGELIPMTQDFWAPDRPNAVPGSLQCLWMSALFVGYRWDDRNCDIYADYPTYAFCEIPQ